MRAAALTAGLVALVLAACGSDDAVTDTSSDTSNSPESTDVRTPLVVASTSIWAVITGNVA